MVGKVLCVIWEPVKRVQGGSRAATNFDRRLVTDYFCD